MSEAPIDLEEELAQRHRFLGQLKSKERNAKLTAGDRDGNPAHVESKPSVKESHIAEAGFDAVKEGELVSPLPESPLDPPSVDMEGKKALDASEGLTPAAGLAPGGLEPLDSAGIGDPADNVDVSLSCLESDAGLSWPGSLDDESLANFQVGNFQDGESETRFPVASFLPLAVGGTIRPDSIDLRTPMDRSVLPFRIFHRNEGRGQENVIVQFRHAVLCKDGKSRRHIFLSCLNKDVVKGAADMTRSSTPESPTGRDPLGSGTCVPEFHGYEDKDQTFHSQGHEQETLTESSSAPAPIELGLEPTVCGGGEQKKPRSPTGLVPYGSRQVEQKVHSARQWDENKSSFTHRKHCTNLN